MLGKYLLHRIKSLVSSTEVGNAWRYTSCSQKLSYMVFLTYADFFTFRFQP